jgi:sugar phosphate isomerase/epimerase
VNTIALAPTSLPNTPPLEYVDACAKAGYEAIGIRVHRSPGVTYPFHPITDDPEGARQVKSALAASGMDVVDALSFYMQPEMDFESFMAPLDFAREIGATYALIIGDDPEWDRMVQNYGRFNDICNGLGLIVAIEAPVVRREINTMAKALKLIADAGNRGVLDIDPLHFHRLNQDPAMLKDIDPKLMPYSQLTDGASDLSVGGRSALGKGDVPLYAILDQLPAETPFSLEWPAPRDSNYTSYEWAKLALEGSTAYLNEHYATKR